MTKIGWRKLITFQVFNSFFNPQKILYLYYILKVENCNHANIHLLWNFCSLGNTLTMRETVHWEEHRPSNRTVSTLKFKLQSCKQTRMAKYEASLSINESIIELLPCNGRHTDGVDLGCHARSNNTRKMDSRNDYWAHRMLWVRVPNPRESPVPGSRSGLEAESRDPETRMSPQHLNILNQWNLWSFSL